MTGEPLANFSEPTRQWFATTFGEPTFAQQRAWPAIQAGEHTLVCAPTGSGKTLAAFLAEIDALSGRPYEGTKVVYISPLRALAVDVDKNLRAPLVGIGLAAERLDQPLRIPTVGVRTGDTSAQERRRLVRDAPDILITTPESLYLMATSAARETLRSVTTVIVDEIHALADTKRGAHLAVTLERLAALTHQPPQRIGLSATQRPLSEIAHFLAGNEVDPTTATVRGQRPVTIIDAGIRKPLDLSVIVATEDMAATSTWTSVHPKLLELVLAHQSTIIFVNARRLAERLAAKLNELASGGDSGPGTELVRAHHGSLSREQRLAIEDDLKSGRVRGLVATSSMELGIDMGAVDLVIQVESPGAVSRGLQRVGRAGHQVGAPSTGRFFPKHRGDLLETAVVVERMMSGDIETTRFIRNPLDVAAQQIVATVALEEWPRTALTALLRSSATFGELSDELLVSVLDLLDGRYPSEEFSELRPRIVWERSTDMIRGRAGAQRLAVTNGGTIPDRGLFGVFLPDGARVGELDEEMVYESRVGETFLLGATTWRIEDITFERVVVTPAPGLPGKMPFWHGDGPGRPAELGRALGAFVRELRTMDPVSAAARLRERNLLDELAAANLLAYLEDQQASSGVVPDDRTVVIERFRDEIGDWRVCVLTPFGARVHAPWAMVIRERLEQSGAEDVEIMWTDDGIIFRLPEAMDRLDLSDICVDADVAQETVLSVLPTSAMFASRFREAAARALLLPRRRPDQRTPLWQQRQRAGSLLTVASKYPTFPILLETTRECVNDVFDLPALGEVLESIAQRRTRVVHVDTDVASPMAASLLFSWISVYMYEGDAPLAERRASALALDPDLLRELLGDAELRSLLDPAVIALVEAELQRTAPSHHARDLDEVHDLLRRLGPLTRDGIAERVVEDLDVANAVAVLTQSKRAIEVRVADRQVIADSADAALLRDALGVSLPLGLPASCTEPVLNPLRSLVQRYARSHGPFTVAELVQWCGASPAAANAQLAELAEQRQVVAGEFRPGGRGQEWCEPEVLRQLRRRSLAALRREVEAVESEVLGRFLPTWQGIGSRRSGTDAVLDVVGQLQGAPLVASTLDSDVFGCRVAGYRPGDLDSLVAAGEVVWQGCGSIGAADGRITLAFRSDAALYLQRISQEDPTRPDGPHHEAIRALLAERGASFWTELVAGVAALDLEYEDSVVVGALWDLVWAGEVSNDSFAPLRAWMTGPQKSSSSRAKGRPGHARPGRLRSAGPRSGAGRWSLIAEPDAELTTTERALATARQLLDRYGVLSREMALAEGTTAGFAGVYPALKALEEQGSVRRGYFVAGLGAAQFAIPAAVDLLRRLRGEADQEQATVVVLAATDPAQPYGAVLSWPSSGGKPSRSAGARVVVCNGRAVAWLDRTGKTLLTFSDIAGTGDLAGHDNQGSDAGFAAETWVPALAGLVADGRMHKLEIAKVDGVSVAASPLLPTLRANGFVDSYRGVVLRG